MQSLSKINYPPAVLGYIQNALQIAFLGELQFVCPELVGTYGFHHELLKWGVPEAHIHTTLTAAEEATLGDRNDVVVAMPGSYLEAAEIGWDKAYTHLIGMGGSNAARDIGNVEFHTTDTGIATILNITGIHCQFHNVRVVNHGDNSSCLSAILLDAKGAYFKNVGIVGTYSENQCDQTAAASLYIDANGYSAIFEDCIIGSDTHFIRSAANSGVLAFISSSGGPQSGLFRNCQFMSYSHTATVAMVRIASTSAIDRTWLFDNCLFANHAVNYQVDLNECFYCPPYVATANIVLKDCLGTGFAEWMTEDPGKFYQSNMPVASAYGGITTEPSQYFGEG